MNTSEKLSKLFRSPLAPDRSRCGDDVTYRGGWKRIIREQRDDARWMPLRGLSTRCDGPRLFHTAGQVLIDAGSPMTPTLSQPMKLLRNDVRTTDTPTFGSLFLVLRIKSAESGRGDQFWWGNDVKMLL